RITSRIANASRRGLLAHHVEDCWRITTLQDCSTMAMLTVSGLQSGMHHSRGAIPEWKDQAANALVAAKKIARLLGLAGGQQTRMSRDAPQKSASTAYVQAQGRPLGARDATTPREAKGASLQWGLDLIGAEN
ncbi:MAG: hypothetical protein ACM3ZE_19380, partial [Myxococcales bacterium]